MKKQLSIPYSMLLFVVLIVGGCATSPSPVELAMQARDKPEVFRLLRSEKDPQAAKDDAFGHCIWNVARFPKGGEVATFYAGMARELRQDGANMYASTLTYMVGGNSAEAIQLLKDLGFDLNRPYSHYPEFGALIHFAAAAGNAESIERLARAGANLNLQDGNKWTPLALAVTKWGADLEKNKIYTEAVQKNEANEVRKAQIAARALVRYGADVNARFMEDGRTPLLQAALQNRPDIMQFLISAGAQNVRDFVGDDLAKYIEYGKNKAQYNEEKRQEQLAQSRANRQLLGQIATATVAAGVIASTNIPAENKAQLVSAVVADVASDGRAGATAALNQQLANAPAAPTNSAAQSAPTSGSNRASASTPARPAAPISTPNESQRTWTWIADKYFAGTSVKEAEACKYAEKQAAEFSPTMAGNKQKLLSRGSCDCHSYQAGMGRLVECRIPYRMEVTSPFDPNRGFGTAEGMSK